MNPLSSTTEQDTLLTEAQASQLLSLSVRTLQAWRSQGRGPKFVRVGRAVRYWRRHLVIYIKEQTVSPRLCQMAGKDS